ncbi:MAG: D-hexose-6-phosphate mutarotase [Gammaproteobacteria bacterium]|nr:D-hexose-6-phosphate mutarotase [Gammaproteobacteria bacterium]MBU3996389.1 D-hexose-6-phosphate mutarotase [Gammaproteobacteria bacterium]MBU4019251.1 D-hexose-6-phosphate mutarotase [Gammaproteobacteria bacterium]MBU4078969.1 D-hexose-6-phosphate mutarotase [Gammaproteobacteria bacterium]MBU4115319.1 D-hexose-6-phosphate mutarotase [Gammaproteobacteria bacterium]
MRTRLWDLRSASPEADGQVLLRLGLSDDASTRALWDFAFDLELCVTVGPTLRLALSTRNTGAAAFTITQALHSYLCVSDIEQTSVLGLDGCDYLDKVQNFAPARQSGAVEFGGETDRIYTGTRFDCLIEDRAGGRSIRVAKQGSTSTVVWNPWREREQALTDMAAGEHRHMLCVETCNAGPDQITLAPGAAHTLVATMSVA